ncbi:MAG: sulfite exporter TauE/SafE family protein [Clostridia bacterium]|nr:sulfite exporter TauE/SafE family protein [Clostridia bacterium]
MDMPLWMLAVLVGYFVKGVAGIGNTLVVTSAMSYTRTNAEITPVELLLCIPTNLVVTWVYRKHINWKLAVAPLCMVLIGDILGVLLLKNVDVTAMKMVFGVVLILLSVEQLWRELRGKPGKAAHPALMLALGISAGVLCGMFGVGALLAAYLSRVTTDDMTYKGTMSVIFTVENAFRIVAYSVTGLLTTASLINAAMLLPFMGAGLFLGIRLSSRMNARTMRIIIGAMLLISGVPLLLAGL